MSSNANATQNRIVSQINANEVAVVLNVFVEKPAEPTENPAGETENPASVVDTVVDAVSAKLAEIGFVARINATQLIDGNGNAGRLVVDAVIETNAL